MLCMLSRKLVEALTRTANDNLHKNTALLNFTALEIIKMIAKIINTNNNLTSISSSRDDVRDVSY